MDRARQGAALLIGAGPPSLRERSLFPSRKVGKGCCASCDDHGGDCGQSAPSVAGLSLSDMQNAQWAWDHRWPIAAGTLAAGGILFATVAYLVNRD